MGEVVCVYVWVSVWGRFDVSVCMGEVVCVCVCVCEREVVRVCVGGCARVCVRACL